MTYDQIIKHHNRRHKSIREKAWAFVNGLSPDYIPKQLETQVKYINLLHESLAATQLESYSDDDLKRLLHDVWLGEATMDVLLMKVGMRTGSLELRVAKPKKEVPA